MQYCHTVFSGVLFINTLSFLFARYSGEGHDVLSATDMMTAIHSNGGVKGVFATAVAVDQKCMPKTRTKIPNISTMNNFEFCLQGVLTRRAHGIGKGHLIGNEQLKDNISMDGFQVTKS